MKKLIDWLQTPRGALVLLLAHVPLIALLPYVGTFGLIVLCIGAVSASGNLAIAWASRGSPAAIRRVYVAGAAGNWPQVRRVQSALRMAGFDITHDWTQSFVTGQYTETTRLTRTELQRFAREDIEGVFDADALVMVLPAARGSHTEFGMALALGLPIVLLEGHSSDARDQWGQECPFYYAKCVERAGNIIAVIQMLKNFKVRT